MGIFPPAQSGTRDCAMKGELLTRGNPAFLGLYRCGPQNQGHARPRHSAQENPFFGFCSFLRECPGRTP